MITTTKREARCTCCLDGASARGTGHGSVLGNIRVVRPREIWFALGAACLAVGTVLSAFAVGYYLKEQHYSLSSSPHMIGAYTAFGAALMFFAFAVTGWRGPWRRLLGFPRITVIVRQQGFVAASRVVREQWKIPTTLLILKVYFINTDPERNVCIRDAYLRRKTKPGSLWGYWQISSAPHDELEYRNPVQAMDLPVNLAPHAGSGGYLIFELPTYQDGELAPGGPSCVEIIDALSEEWAVFPVGLGTFTLGHGLVRTTIAERITGPPGPPVLTLGSPWEIGWSDERYAEWAVVAEPSCAEGASAAGEESPPEPQVGAGAFPNNVAQESSDTA